MTTNQMDHVTADERKQLRGYCEECRVWTPFERGTDPETCAECHGPFTPKAGLQVTSQRTPLPIKSRAITKQDKIAA